MYACATGHIEGPLLILGSIPVYMMVAVHASLKDEDKVGSKQHIFRVQNYKRVHLLFCDKKKSLFSQYLDESMHPCHWSGDDGSMVLNRSQICPPPRTFPHGGHGGSGSVGDL